MSSTNRGSQRSPADNYKTPSWCTRRLLEARPDLLKRKGYWLEPCAGMGDIIKVVHEFQPSIRVDAVELRKECSKTLDGLENVISACPKNFLEFEVPTGFKYAVTITNPPFRLAQEVLEHCLEITKGEVIMLLRLNYVGSEKRFDFMARQMANDILVLPNRPPFSRDKHGKWGTDSIEYAWFCWDTENPTATGRLRMLPLTPLEERKKG